MTRRFTTREAANILGINASRVRQLIQELRLTPERFGRDICLTREQIAIMADRNTKRGPKAKPA